MRRRSIESVEEYIKRIEAQEFGFDKWITYYQHEIHNCEKKRACYVLFVKNEPVYIGQTSNARGRIGTHFSSTLSKYITLGVSEDDIYCKVKFPKKYGYEAMLEKRLIKRLQPRLNLALKNG